MSDLTVEELNWASDDPASRWFAEFSRWEAENLPERLRGRVDFVKHGEDSVHVDHLFIDLADGSKGYGRKILEAVVTTADAHGITLTLDPAWIGEEDEGTVSPTATRLR